MNFVEMSNEEWEEVRRQHDAFVHSGELEMETTEIHESASPVMISDWVSKHLEAQLQDDLKVGAQH